MKRKQNEEAYPDGYNSERILFNMDGMNSDVEYEVDDQLEEYLDQWEQDFYQKHGRAPTDKERDDKYMELMRPKNDEPSTPSDPDLPF